MDLGIGGRRAAVAAASAGLGFGSAAALAAEGARVTICGSDDGRAAAAARIGAGHLVADLTSPDEAERFVREAAAAMGGLDILVVNGPGPAPGTALGTPADAYPAALDASLLSVVRMCLAAVPLMREQGWGRIVAITSLSVRQPMANLVLSNTARAGATGFLRTLAREVIGDGITVNSLLPGGHATDRMRALGGGAEPVTDPHAPGRLGDPADFGALVAFLCSQQANYVTGTTMQVDGGDYLALL